MERRAEADVGGMDGKGQNATGNDGTHNSESSVNEQIDFKGFHRSRLLWLLRGSFRPAEFIRDSQSLLYPKRILTFTKTEEMLVIFGPRHM